MRVVFFGTPRFAVPSLVALHNAGHDIVLVVTQPDRPSGRGREVRFGEVKREAMALRLEVFQPHSLTPEVAAFLDARSPDVMVAVAYGLILPRLILELPEYGCVNLHASLLPRYRGAAPVQHAILRGEIVTGVTTLQMDEGIDTGAILLQREAPIGEDETTGDVEQRLAVAGAELLVLTLDGLGRGTLTPRPQQVDRTTYAPRIGPDAARLNWNLPASTLHNHVRAMNPRPGATTAYRGRTVKIWRVVRLRKLLSGGSPVPPGTILSEDSRLLVACGNGEALEVREVQIEGRRRITGEEAVRGRWFADGEVLGEIDCEEMQQVGSE